MSDRSERFAQVLLALIRSIAEYILIAVIVLAIAIAAYALFDLRIVATEADPAVYEIYKPKENRRSFEELVAINDEVIGWINLYGTNIDYPVVQGEDNDKYLSVSADGSYSVAGSIFLDYRNKKDFSDFSNIIHGHNMFYNVMFGDISDFAEEAFFREHPHGDLYFENRHHGLLIIGLAEVDAYRSRLYRLNLPDEAAKKSLLEDFAAESMYDIDPVNLSTDNTYVLLSTCTEGMTNGRHILICRLTDEVYENPFGEDTKTRDTVGGARMRIRFFLIIMMVMAALMAAAAVTRRAELRAKRKS